MQVNINSGRLKSIDFIEMAKDGSTFRATTVLSKEVNWRCMVWID